jgi:hypothetical protein
MEKRKCKQRWRIAMKAGARRALMSLSKCRCRAARSNRPLTIADVVQPKQANHRSTMLTRFLRATLPVVVAGTLGLQPAYADLYTWVDASGGVNVSNLAPPEGARITNVILASAPKPPTRDDEAREVARDAEVQTLTRRVRQLEDEVKSQGSGSNYWYYCRDPAGYYPDAQTCPSGWLQVVPNPTADPIAGAGQ